MPRASTRYLSIGATVEEIEKEASSKTINKTVRELKALLDGERISADSPLRAKLHDTLFKLLRQKARWWYLRGFKRGHETCARKVKSPPKMISRRIRMRCVFLPEKGERILLKSRLKT